MLKCTPLPSGQAIYAREALRFYDQASGDVISGWLDSFEAAYLIFFFLRPVSDLSRSFIIHTCKQPVSEMSMKARSTHLQASHCFC